MPAIELPTITRDRQLHRLVDTYAATEAATALRRAAAHEKSIVASQALKAIAADDVDGFIDAVTAPEFLSLLPLWIRELREVASAKPETGACTVATALKLWLWSMKHFRAGDVVRGELAQALWPLVAARAFVLESAKEPQTARDLSFVYAAHAAASAGATCAELVFGYRRHLTWDAEGCAACYGADELDELEGFIPGIASGARTEIDIIESNGSHPKKAGPCVKFDGLDEFMRLRRRLDGCLTGARIAKDRAAAAIGGSAR